MPLASARQHPENQKENQAGHSSERTVEGRSHYYYYLLAYPSALLFCNRYMNIFPYGEAMRVPEVSEFYAPCRRMAVARAMHAPGGADVRSSAFNKAPLHVQGRGRYSFHAWKSRPGAWRLCSNAIFLHMACFLCSVFLGPFY